MSYLKKPFHLGNKYRTHRKTKWQQHPQSSNIKTKRIYTNRQERGALGRTTRAGPIRSPSLPAATPSTAFNVAFYSIAFPNYLTSFLTLDYSYFHLLVYSVQGWPQTGCQHWHLRQPSKQCPIPPPPPAPSAAVHWVAYVEWAFGAPPNLVSSCVTA